MVAEATSSSLDARTRQVVILTVGAVWESSYELYAHAAEGRRNGLSEKAIGALIAGQLPTELTDREMIAARFAQQLTTNRHIDADLYAEAEQIYSQTSLVHLVLLVGYYQTICAVLNAFEAPSP
jgi:4-carboxymuconolactone decarboxylase